MITSFLISSGNLANSFSIKSANVFANSGFVDQRSITLNFKFDGNFLKDSVQYTIN